MPVLSGREQWRRPVSPRERRWVIRFYLAISLLNAVFAISSAESRVIHAINAILFALGALVFMLRKPASPLNESPS